jgi:hypothetical protein
MRDRRGRRAPDEPDKRRYLAQLLAPIDEPMCSGARGSSAARASRLSDLSGLTVAGDVGEEMDVAPTAIARSLGIESYFNSGRFECVVKPPYASTTKRWVTLAKNKYRDPVAGIIFPDLEQATGWMFVLPRVERRPGDRAGRSRAAGAHTAHVPARRGKPPGLGDSSTTSRQRAEQRESPRSKRQPVSGCASSKSRSRPNARNTAS